MTLFRKILILILAGSILPASAQVAKRSSVTLQHGAHRLGRRTDPAMARWRAYGLGQFLHWGVYAIPGGHWKGKYYAGAAEWIRSWPEMPKDEYDNLYKQFNPTGFDARAWARQAKQMGARYVIITTKHHDGFCLWPSKYTSYTVAHSPYQKDIIGALTDAYKAEGIDVYLYFSIIDWNHSGYRASLNTPADRQAYEGFKTFTRNQLLELLERYPACKGLWFDGTWDKAWVEQAAFADSLETELRSKIPGLVIGSRFRADENGKRHFDSNGDLIGDYEQGWERKIPDNIQQLNGNDWDCVMTIPENQWGYHSDWKGHVKTGTELLEMMVKCNAMDGNFVLNFGPDGNGKIREEETRLAREIGDWMKTNSEAVYNCGYAGLEKQDWGYFTRNRQTGKIYLTIFNRPVNGKVRVRLPAGRQLRTVRELKGATLKTEEIRKQEYFIELKIPGGNIPQVLEMELSEGSSSGKEEEAKT